MNIEEMEKEFNQLMKHGQELIEKLKMEQNCLSNFDVYEINFNGKIERFYCSKEEMTFEKAQELIQKAGKNLITMIELGKEDNSGVERWRHLKDAGCVDWVWCRVYSNNSAYQVNLNDGSVLTNICPHNANALCL